MEVKTFLDILIAVIAVLYLLAQAVERFIEMVKFLLVKIKDPALQMSAKVAVATLVGFGVAALVPYDVLAELGVQTRPVFGYLLTGAITSVGSSVLHALLEWLKTIKLPNQRE